jgi:hypothetical protein
MKILPFILCTAFSFGALAYGVDGNYYADINRELLVLPKSAAMAGADATIFRSAAPLGNPANLANDSTKEASIAYANYFQNTYSTCGVSYLGPVDGRSSFGVSVSYVLIPDIKISDEVRSNENSTIIFPTTIKSSSDLFFRVSYGRKVFSFTDRIQLQAGVAINGERRNLVGWTGYGIGSDFGADVLFQNIDAVAGIVVENITGSYTHWSSDYKEFSYPHMRIGLGWHPEFPYIYGKLTACYLSPDLFTNDGINSVNADSMLVNSDAYGNSLSYVSPNRERIYKNPFMLFLGRYGFEYSILNTVAFRIGFNAAGTGGSFSENLSFGGGLNLLQNHAGIDFAYLSNELSPTYKVCMNFRWF